MGWYVVVKTVKGHRYRYLQHSWREGKRVRTESRYLGRDDGSDGAATAPTAADARSKRAISIGVVRFCREGFESTDATRGGTWYATPESKDLYGGFKGMVIGGNKKIESTLELRNPAMIEIETEDFQAGFSVIASGNGRLLPRQYRKAVTQLARAHERLLERDVEDGGEDFELKEQALLTKALALVDVPRAQIDQIILSRDKLNAAVDAIVTKGLREAGFDALVLTDGATTHVLRFGSLPRQQAEEQAYDGENPERRGVEGGEQIARSIEPATVSRNAPHTPEDALERLQPAGSKGLTGKEARAEARRRQRKIWANEAVKYGSLKARRERHKAKIEAAARKARGTDYLNAFLGQRIKKKRKKRRNLGS